MIKLRSVSRYKSCSKKQTLYESKTLILDEFRAQLCNLFSQSRRPFPNLLLLKYSRRLAPTSYYIWEVGGWEKVSYFAKTDYITEREIRPRSRFYFHKAFVFWNSSYTLKQSEAWSLLRVSWVLARKTPKISVMTYTGEQARCPPKGGIPRRSGTPIDTHECFLHST